MNSESFLEHVLITPYKANWRESAKAVRDVMQQFPDFTFSHVEWMRWAWPGGYPIYYICADGEVMCSQCANDNFMATIDPDSDWLITDGDINYEDNDMVCINCNKQVESAYGYE